MKKHLLGLAALSLLVVATSCNKETVESATDGKIAFKAVLGKQTRAQEFLGTSWKIDDAFDIKGYASGNTSTTPFFAKTLSTSTAGAGTWSYTGPVDQPGYVINYYTWFPTDYATYGTLGSGTVSPTITCEVPAYYGDQKDLIAAAISTSNQTVALNFKHILSQINFAIQGVQNVKVEINDLSVNGILREGTYTFNANAAGNGVGSWALEADTTNYAYVGIANKTAGAATVTYMGNGNSVYTNTNALMLLPQSFSTTDEATFGFNFKLYDMADNVLKSDTTTVRLSDFTTTTWVQGTRYLYLIDFTGYMAGGPITFTVQVADWIPAASEIAQTVEAAQATAGSIETAIARHNTLKTASLTVFPVSIPVNPTAAIQLANLGSNFVGTDKIVLNFTGEDAADALASFPVSLTGAAATGWTLDSSKSPIITISKNN